VREGSKVRRLLLVERQQQSHDQRGAEPFLRRIDAALHQERRAHRRGDVERRDELQVRPVGAAEHEAIAQGAPDRVRRDEHPLRARRLRGTEAPELIDERAHATTRDRIACGVSHYEDPKDAKTYTKKALTCTPATNGGPGRSLGQSEVEGRAAPQAAGGEAGGAARRGHACA
jgi:hypothetical protein